MIRAPQFQMLEELHKLASPPTWRAVMEKDSPFASIVVPTFSVSEGRMFTPKADDIRLACELRNSLPNLLELRKRLRIFASFGDQFRKAKDEGAITEDAYKGLLDLMIAFGELERDRSEP